MSFQIHRDLRERIEETKRRKRLLEEEKAEKAKRGLFEKISEVKEGKAFQEKRRASARKLVSFAYWAAAVSVLGAVFVVSFLALGRFYLNRGKYICPESDNQNDSGLIETASQDYRTVENFVASIFREYRRARESKAGKMPEIKLPANPESRKELIKTLDFLKDKAFKISYVQSDRKAGCYYVMCEFNESGAYYFTVKKDGDSLCLLAVEFYS